VKRINRDLNCWAAREKSTGPKQIKWRSSAQQRSCASGPSDEVGSTRQRLLTQRNGTRAVDRRIRQEINGAQASSSPTRCRGSAGEPRGSEGVPRLRRSATRFAATLVKVLKRLVQVAALGEARIDGCNLRVLAASSLQFRRIRRRLDWLMDREGAVKRGE
jgi:hypothetical protein